MDYRKEIASLRDEKYKKFSKKLIPGDSVILGVRMAPLRTLAREGLKYDWRSFIRQADYNIHEEALLCGLMIAYAKISFTERSALITDFVPKIKNWAVCDSVCATFKLDENEKAGMYGFLQPYLGSASEFPSRFGFVMLLSNFEEEKYADRILQHIKNIKSDGYYAKMAAAWLLADCAAKFPEKTVSLLEKKILDPFVQNKGIQKARESFRTDEKIKDYINTLKIGGKNEIAERA